ncbi:hypothetical protein [Gracilibacillus phocaeensis]|uniref:hypothetical protein n=1 Tax=Gracilibacillus phocaeensis TaxID=2042304 RepID=UPI001030ECE3|nr:hypothetical protein [Gracilibacillus phocaeensis]
MQKELLFAEKLLIGGYTAILLFMIVQDLVPLGRLNDVAAITSERSMNEILIVTLIGVVQIVLLMAGLLFFAGKKYPIWARIWLIVHPSCILLGAVMSWWIPYLFGIGAEEKVEGYTAMFGNTHAFLPVINGIVPNTLHTMFHLLLLVCILLTVYLVVTKRKRISAISTY